MTVPGELLVASAPVLLAALVLCLLLRRRRELLETARSRDERAAARVRGSHKARLQHPLPDLSKCIGCGTCVAACPEDGVLQLVHGQAVVVHGARCVGHGLCAQACPTGAIALTLGDLSDRRDLPALDGEGQAVGVPGLFLAGELTGFALVRTAIEHGRTVADAVHRRCREGAAVPAVRALAGVGAGAGAGRGSPWERAGEEEEPLDLVVVGAGPGGLSCSLRAKELGLRFLTVEQEAHVGGTVAAYPRRKLVMTQPVELPLHGRLPRLSYLKEELVELWERVTTGHALPIRTGVRLERVRRDAGGAPFVVETSAGELRARNVCLALGRRGTPRRLGVPGEDLPKVAYALLDAASYRDAHVLVVGGGDSAVEAAIGLAGQPGNTVTLSYRKADFFRLKARNEERVRGALADGRLRAVFSSQVERIDPDTVTLRCGDGRQELPNDHVFVFAGGIPPFGLLEQAGVSFDPDDRPAVEGAVTRQRGLVRAVAVVCLVAAAVAAWAWTHRDYYALPPAERVLHPDHGLLRPGGGVGLVAGALALGLFTANLLHLVRRRPRLGRWLPGSLARWMAAHVATGLLALLCVLLHAGFSGRPTVGGHALLALGAVVVTGTIGRWFYAFVPRAANGREDRLAEVRSRLAALSAEWDRSGAFGQRVRERVECLIAAPRWPGGWLGRVASLWRSQRRLAHALAELRRLGRDEDVPAPEVRRIVGLARRAHRLGLQAAHLEELRGVLASWRWFHRWLALLMVLLAVVHVVTAVRFAHLDLGGGG